MSPQPQRGCLRNRDRIATGAWQSGCVSNEKIIPLLQSQHAILAGWASELPVMVKMRDLPEIQRPYASDPDFWDVWTGSDQDGNPVSRPVDWTMVVHDWQTPAQATANDEDDPFDSDESEMGMIHLLD